MIKNMKISHKLILGYLIVILLTACSGIISISSLIQISSFSNDFYNHPFTVTTAALQAKADMIEMRSIMKDVITANSESDIEKIQDKVNSLEQSVYKQFVIIHQRFLGDPLLVNKAEELFKQWKSTRDEVFMFALGGKREEADKIITGRAAEQVGQIFNEMNQVTDFAQGKAQEFNANAIMTSKNAQTNIVIVIVAIITATYIIRSSLFQISYIDILTEISNRRHFKETYQKTWKHAMEKNIPLSVLMIDIDFLSCPCSQTIITANGRVYRPLWW